MIDHLYVTALLPPGKKNPPLAWLTTEPVGTISNIRLRLVSAGNRTTISIREARNPVALPSAHIANFGISFYFLSTSMRYYVFVCLELIYRLLSFLSLYLR